MLSTPKAMLTISETHSWKELKKKIMENMKLNGRKAHRLILERKLRLSVLVQFWNLKEEQSSPTMSYWKVNPSLQLLQMSFTLPLLK